MRALVLAGNLTLPAFKPPLRMSLWRNGKSRFNLTFSFKTIFLLNSGLLLPHEARIPLTADPRNEHLWLASLVSICALAQWC